MSIKSIDAFLKKCGSSDEENLTILLAEAKSLLTDILKGLETSQLDLTIPNQIPPRKDEIEKACRGIGHDFNGILANVRGLVEITQMMEPNAPENVQKTFVKILKLVERGHHATELVRMYGRVLSYEKTRLNINQCIRRRLNDVKMVFDLDYNIDYNCPEKLFVNFDETQFETLIMQLCRNSLQAIKTRGVASELSIKIMQINDTNIELSVSDNGLGIAPNIGERVYYPFYSTKKATEGLGLGLSVVKQIVMNHNGQIYYTSQENSGTTFTCNLPVVDL